MAETFRGPDSSPNCSTCPCAVNGVPQRPIRGAGSLRSLAIIGEGPSTEELSQGWPFVGPSGKLLQQALQASSIDRHSIWITNAILCQRPRDEKALEQAITCCRPRLQHELDLVNPSALLVLGATAAQAVGLPVQSIKAARGTIQFGEIQPKTPCVTAIHPAAILRGGGADAKGVSGGKNKMNVDAQYVFLESDVAKAYDLARNPAQPLWQDNIELITDNNHAKFDTFWYQTPMPFLTIDLEWGKDNAITWLGLATPKNAISIYYPHADADMRRRIRFAGESLVPKLFQNLQADVPIWESQIGPLNGQFEDTMLMHHAAYPGAAHDLQNVAGQFLLIPPWKADRKNEEKDAAKATAKANRDANKLAKQAAHAAHNDSVSAAAKERKAKRIKAHEERNLTAKLLKLIGG